MFWVVHSVLDSFHQTKTVTASEVPYSVTSVSVWMLLFIYFSRNQLSSLSPCVNQLEELRVLLLSNNRLSSLPDELTELKNLMELVSISVFNFSFAFFMKFQTVTSYLWKYIFTIFCIFKSVIWLECHLFLDLILALLGWWDLLQHVLMTVV